MANCPPTSAISQFCPGSSPGHVPFAFRPGSGHDPREILAANRRAPHALDVLDHELRAARGWLTNGQVALLIPSNLDPLYSITRLNKPAPEYSSPF
jgi:hypothetical protein